MRVQLLLMTLLCGGTTSLLADQIVLSNGDRITGTIVGKDGKNLTVKTDLLGTVTTSWDKVVSVKTDTPLNVVMPDNKTVLGTMTVADGKAEILPAGAAPISVPAPQLGAIRDDAGQKAFERLLHPGWGQLWIGTGSIGFAGTSGNAETLTFTTGVTASRTTRTDKTMLYFNSVKASALANGKNSGTAQAVRGGLGYNRNIGSRAFVNGFNDYEYDKFQNLDLRFVLGGGFGYHALKRERSQLDLLGGGDFNHSAYGTPAVRKSAEAYWGDEFNLRLKGNTSLVQSARMFNDLTNTGSYRVNFDVGSSTKIAKWLVWNISLSDRYLNRPAAGRKANDFLYTMGVGLSFRR